MDEAESVGTPVARRRGHHLWLGCVFLPLLILGFEGLTTEPTTHLGGYDNDGRHYAAMSVAATSPDDATWQLAHTAPYCWRVLTPAIVSILPFDTLTSFRVLSFFCNWASLALVFVLMHRHRVRGAAAVFGVLLYAGVFWSLKHSYYSPAYIDFQSAFFTLLLLHLALERRLGWVAAVGVLAVLQRETLIALIPVACVVALRGTPRPRLAAVLWCVAAPTAALVAIRYLIVPSNDLHVTEVVSTVLREQFGELDFWPRFALEILSGLGVLPLIAMTRTRALARLLRREPHWIILIAAAALSLLGGFDKARLFQLMVPALVIIDMVLIQTMLEDITRPKLLWLTGTLLLHFYLGHQLFWSGTHDEHLRDMAPIYYPGPIAPRLLLVAGLVLAWTLLTLWFERWGRRSCSAPRRGPSSGRRARSSTETRCSAALEPSRRGSTAI